MEKFLKMYPGISFELLSLGLTVRRVDKASFGGKCTKDDKGA